MKESGGPAKKLAPAHAPESVCPHAYTDNEGLQLEVDCSECAGAQDLNNRRCMVGVVNAVAKAAAPEAIVLKRFIHRRYRRGALRTVVQAAAEAAALSRASASASTPSDRKCRTCPCNPGKLIALMRAKLLEDPAKYVGEHLRSNEIFSEGIAGSCSCEKAGDCLRRARSISTILDGGI